MARKNRTTDGDPMQDDPNETENEDNREETEDQRRDASGVAHDDPTRAPDAINPAVGNSAQAPPPDIDWASREGSGPDVTSGDSVEKRNMIQAQTEADGHKGDAPPDASIGGQAGPGAAQVQGDPQVQDAGPLKPQHQMQREELISTVTTPEAAMPIIRSKMTELHSLVHNIGAVAEAPFHVIEDLMAELQYLFGIVRKAR